MVSQPEPPRRSSAPFFLIAGLAIAAGLGALTFALTRGPSASPAPVANATAPTATATPANAYTITSTNPKVKVAALTALPASPGSADGDCNDYFAKPPRSPAARAAAAKGWLIADEARLGPLTAVLIASSFTTSTSGFCFANNGNVALFDGDRLVGLVYSAKGADEQIGAIERVGAALRIGMDGPATPLGDLTLSGHALRFGALPASDSVCGGRRRVPNIYDLPIAEARRKLIANGWTPVPSSEEVGPNNAELRSQGIVEVTDCAGTGLGQCGFNYAAGRDRLDVGTTDWPPLVSDYSVRCG